MSWALVVEDQSPVRRALAALVTRVHPELQVHAAADLRSARAWLEQPLELRLALVDLGLPDGSGLDLLAELRVSRPQAMTVVTTIYDDDRHLFAALAAGAGGYLLKDQALPVLEDHLRRLDQGLPALSPSIARRILEHFRQPPPAAPASDTPPLTPRETEVLALIAKGLRRSEVASTLGISENTVAHFIKDTYRKLGIGSRAEAALEAARRGLV